MVKENPVVFPFIENIYISFPHFIPRSDLSNGVDIQSCTKTILVMGIGIEYMNT